MSIHSFYDLFDGHFVGQSYSGPDLESNTPPGCGAMPGEHDYLARRVDLTTGQVVDWQPPAPPNDEFQTWAWNAEASRWVAAKTTKSIAAEVRAERDARLAVCDWVVTRSTEMASAVPTDWAAYRTALRNLPAQTGFPSVITWPVPPAT